MDSTFQLGTVFVPPAALWAGPGTEWEADSVSRLVTVIGGDIDGLDRDGDGIGCGRCPRTWCSGRLAATVDGALVAPGLEGCAG